MQLNQHSALTLDYYALTMADVYLQQGRAHEIAYFDYFFRSIPEQGGYAIFAGLATLFEHLEALHFSAEECDFLREKALISPQLCQYLRDFRFTGDIWAMREGSVVFPNEPLLTVRAPLVQCLLLEASLLSSLNHQSLIATKAARMVRAAQGRKVFEFGARRAHGVMAALYGARAAYLAGVDGTSNVLAQFAFDMPCTGTMAHAYVQSFDDEYQAFLHYAQIHPQNTVVLVDTYDVLRQGIPNAIRLHQEYLAPRGEALRGVRIDSGDLAYLSIQARQMLDAAGLHETQIIASNALDEFLIEALLNQGAQIDAFGVGERLITAKADPVFGGVYKIVGLEDAQGRIVPRIKLSATLEKTTTPAFKNVWRLYDQEDKAFADVITLHDERIDEALPYDLFDPQNPWKRKRVHDFKARPLLDLQWQGGKRLHSAPSLEASRRYCQSELNTFWDELKRLRYPHQYYVDLSQPLWQLKQELIKTHSLQEEA